VQPEIIYSLEAQQDLYELQLYIAERSGLLRAEFIIGRILKTIELIAYHPGMGSSRAVGELSQSCRVFVEAPWLIIYLPLPDLSGIEIVRVVDGRRDLSNAL
jgi:plasmid stabilization system protein ParE